MKKQTVKTKTPKTPGKKAKVLKPEKVKRDKLFNGVLFATRLEELRKRVGVKQYEIAESLDRSRCAYAVIITGKVSPSLELILAIRKYFAERGINVSMDYLLGLSDYQNEAKALVELKETFERNKAELDSLKEINKLQKELLKKG